MSNDAIDNLIKWLSSFFTGPVEPSDRYSAGPVIIDSRAWDPNWEYRDHYLRMGRIFEAIFGSKYEAYRTLNQSSIHWGTRVRTPTEPFEFLKMGPGLIDELITWLMTLDVDSPLETIREALKTVFAIPPGPTSQTSTSLGGFDLANLLRGLNLGR